MQLAELTSPEIAALSRDIPVIIPVAAVEQHGPHLPVYTDSLLLAEVIRRCEALLSESTLVAPLQWLGNSEHHLDFGGTLSAAPRTYLNLLTELAGSFIHQGFRRILFLNGHGGNDVPGRQAVFELRQRHRDRTDLLLLFGTYWLLGTSEPACDDRFLQQQMGHACEWETSMILRLNPGWVKDARALEPVPFGNPFQPAVRGWVTQDRSRPGYIGHPAAATADKGEWLFQRFAEDTSRILGRVLRWDAHSWDG